MTMTNSITAIAPKDTDLSQVKTISDQSQITDTYALYLDDESHSFDGAAEKLFFPKTEDELALLLRNANDAEEICGVGNACMHFNGSYRH